MSFLKKPFKLTAPAAFVIAIAATGLFGVTYAGFTAFIGSPAPPMEVASLDVKAAVAESSNAGSVFARDITLTNVGDADSVIEVIADAFTCSIKKENEDIYQTEPAVLFKKTVAPKGEGQWYKQSSGDAYYVKLEPNTEASFTLFVTPADVRGYENAEMQVSGELKATQSLNEAIEAEFGVTRDDMEEIDA
ncbi:MAG: hypothetical protein LBL35_06130 [Clostridiales bacterium]|nr:hypothetical protein [Clostridiales bacterium]